MSRGNNKKLEELQKLVLDVIKIERNHRIPGMERRENVVEHSFSVAMLCWKIFEITKPPLDIVKIFKYALVHDFSERGQRFDINAYASDKARTVAKRKEKKEIEKIIKEFKSFKDFAKILNDYEKLKDEESIFVWSVDKMQCMILGKIDNWRPYAIFGVNYKQFCEKNKNYLDKCSIYVKGIFKEVFNEDSKTYYDNK